MDQHPDAGLLDRQRSPAIRWAGRGPPDFPASAAWVKASSREPSLSRITASSHDHARASAPDHRSSPPKPIPDAQPARPELYYYRLDRGQKVNNAVHPTRGPSAASSPSVSRPGALGAVVDLKHAARNVDQPHITSASPPAPGSGLLAATSATSKLLAGKPSVKDLKKRFDQNAASSAIPRLRAAPSSPRTLRAKPANAALGASAQDVARVRQSTSDIFVQPIASARSFSMDQSTSFAKHVGERRSSFADKLATSQSFQGLQPNASTAAPHPALFRPVSGHNLQRLDCRSLRAGLNTLSSDKSRNVQGQRQKATATFCFEHQEPAARNRSFSDPDADSATSTTCSGTQAGDSSSPRQSPSIARHMRSYSEINLSQSRGPASRKTARKMPRLANPCQSSPTSKLPVAVRKINTPSEPLSPSSTRSSSPATLKWSPQSARNGWASPRPSRVRDPSARAKMVKKPLSDQTSPLPSPDSWGVSVRARARSDSASKRPRPPQTASPSRSRAAGGGTLSNANWRANFKKEPDGIKDDSGRDGAARRKNKSVGTINFEERREHIRLAYSKSIRETHASRHHQGGHQIRIDESKSAVQSATCCSGAAPAASDPAQPDHIGYEGGAPQHPIDAQSPSPRRTRPSHGAASNACPGASSLSLLTTLHSGAPGMRSATRLVDSPTLGLSEDGSLPDPLDDAPDEPISAHSETSGITSFDGKPQTNPPTRVSSLSFPSSQTRASPTGARGHGWEDAPRSSPRRQDPVEDRPQKGSGREEWPSPSSNFLPADVSLMTKASCPREREACDTNANSGSNHHIKQTSKEIFPRHEQRSGEHEAKACPHDAPGELQEDTSSQRTAHRAFRACPSQHLTDRAPSPVFARSASRGGGGGGDRSCVRIASSGDVPEDAVPPRLARLQEATGADGSFEAETTTPPPPQSHAGWPSSPSTGTNLTSTSPGPPMARSSQSIWTDVSAGSSELSNTMGPPAFQSRGTPALFGHATIFESSAPTQDKPRGEEPVAGEVASHNASLQGPVGVKAPFPCASQHQLPELDTGDGFFIPYLSPRTSNASSYYRSPSHEPPPVPGSTPGSALVSRGSSVFRDQTSFRSATAFSGRESGEYLSHSETPQSEDATSLSTVDQALDRRVKGEVVATKNTPCDDDVASEKERHRLFLRHNVIKELVDMEASFVRDMNVVEEIYKGTAEACPKLDGKTVKVIFRNSDEIIKVHSAFLAELREAVGRIVPSPGASSQLARNEHAVIGLGIGRPATVDNASDFRVAIGPIFQANLARLKTAHETYLRNSDQAAKRLIQMQQDPTIKVWLKECNEVAADLTCAWNLDSLLIKPMQRITKYPTLILSLLQHTPHHHPDREALMKAKNDLETAILDINQTKKHFELVGQIVGRKRKESDVRAGFARAFGKRADKLPASANRPSDDAEFVKLNEKFGDDFLRLQVVLRDVEFYTRQASAYVHEFLQYLSSIELVMRLQPGAYPELELKWVQFNISARDLQKVALEEHLAQVRKHVIEPFEQVIKAYGNPSLAMKKRQKRRLDFERLEQLKRAGKTADPKSRELVDQYEALNDTLKKELPRLSCLTERVGNICLGNLVKIQAKWYALWTEKVKTVLGDCIEVPDLAEVVASFQKDHLPVQEQMTSIGILSSAGWSRASQSTTTTNADDAAARPLSRPRPFDADARGCDGAPTLPSHEFLDSRSGSFTLSPPRGENGRTAANGLVTNPYQYYYRDCYAGIHFHGGGGGSSSPRSADMTGASRSLPGTGVASTRPSTGRSFDSVGLARQSSENASAQPRELGIHQVPPHPPQETRRLSNLFHSALPLSDDAEGSQRSSRASCERGRPWRGYNVLWLAAPLFEFNIATTKHEAGYPYLTYQAGEIFDVIAEKGELWLAKNQDDTTDQVGWIWSKHFARLADA